MGNARGAGCISRLGSSYMSVPLLQGLCCSPGKESKKSLSSNRHSPLQDALTHLDSSSSTFSKFLEVPRETVIKA